MSTCLSHPVGRIRDDPTSDGMVRLVDELCATRGLGGIEPNMLSITALDADVTGEADRNASDGVNTDDVDRN